MAKINQKEFEVLKSLEVEWKWVARDSKVDNGGNLFAYSGKTFKRYDVGEWDWDCGRGIRSIDNHLFQFIQWEDEEPWNIADLIREYERDETEMKKDIEWLKKEIGTEMIQLEPNRKERWSDVKYQTLRNVAQKIDQLDEPEVLSSEWIKNNQRMWTSAQGEEYYVPSNKLYGKIVPKQELPTIPQFVSGWIEETKKQSKSYIYAIARIYDKYETDESLSEEEYRIFQWMEAYDNDEVFARAWLDGYTVEEEPKYNVEIKSSFGTVGIFLFKQGDEVLSGDNFKAYCPKEDEFRLTEQEIRGFQNGDVLFEHFAVKAEELEE